MRRQQQLAVDDEEELLRLQEQFQTSAAQGESRPAAKVTRISRRLSAAADRPPAGSALPHGCAEHGPSCQGHHGAQHQRPGSEGAADSQQMAGLMAAMQAAMKEIVGEVQERQVAAPEPPQPPAPPAASAPGQPGAFPEATHRRLSKFALGRQRQRAASSGAAAGAGALGAAVAPAAEAAGAAPPSEEGRIDAENRQLLASMTPEQVEQAREEVLQRLPPAAAEFLRRRGANKARATAAAAVAAKPAAASGSSALPSPPSGAAPAGSRQIQRPAQPPQRQRQPAGSEARSGAPQASLAARLRFGIDGAVVGLRPADSGADVAPAEAVERDLLRHDDGADATGYSVQEACLLARSSLPQQRVLALRLLRAVLTLSRPGMRPATAALVPLPPAVAEELRQQGHLEAVAGLEWAAVWHHALHTADVVLLLRRSLDDSNLAVAAAAAEALAALLGAAATAEEAAAEAADACPLTGWPAPPLRHMQRPTASGSWVAAPTSPDRRQPGDGVEEDEEALDEQQLAKVDPLSGLLHMQLLERSVYLLTTARAVAAVDPLLSILVRCCQAGKDVADRVLDTPGMLAALKAVLDAPPPPLGATEGSPGSADPAAVAYYAARPKALRVLRQLAAASKAAARQLQESGLVRFVLDQLLRPAGMPVEPAAAPLDSNGSSDGSAGLPSCGGGILKQHGMLTEALRLWRCFGQHGFYLLLLDDAYASICTYFAPPALPLSALAAPSRQLADAVPAAAAEAGNVLQQWSVAREAYATAAQLCWHAARCEQFDSQLSPQCAAALAAGAVTWLAELPLQQLLEACAPCPTSSSGGGGSGAEQQAAAAVATGRLSAYPALAAASASAGCRAQQGLVLGTLAAALHLVGSYWSVQVWHTAADKAAAAAQLATLGLLPPQDGDGVGGPAVLQAIGGMLQQLVGSGPVWAPADSSSSSAEATAAAATAELAVAVARLAAVFLPRPAAAAASAALLSPLYGQQAAARFLGAAWAADATLSQPWDAARQLQLLPLARAAVAGLQAASQSMASSSGGEQQQALPPMAADTALALLQLLPPGDEPTALQLLAVLLSPQQLTSSCAAAQACLRSAVGSEVAQLAADGSAIAAGSNGSVPALPPAQQLSQLLLAGYAAPWLGLVPEPQPAAAEAELEAGRAAVEPPASAALLRPQGSRLPLPSAWMLEELPLPPAEAVVPAEPAAACSGALLLALGWEQQGLRSLAAAAGAAARNVAAALAEHKLRVAVLLVFGEQQEQGGVVPGALHPVAAAQQAEEAELWETPLSRWCLAALLERHCSAAAPADDKAGEAAVATVACSAGAVGAGAGGTSDAASTGLRGWEQQEARQLAERFAAASFGDRLFGAAVALLLRCSVRLDVQLEVLTTLADDQALHLLPPLRMLPGPPSTYLNPPASGANGSSFGHACFGSSSGGSNGSRRQELDLYVKLLTQGPLQRCLAVGDDAFSGPAEAGAAEDNADVGEGDGASLAGCSVAVPLVLHRLACACFADAAQAWPAATSDLAASKQQRRALLIGILQHGGGSDGGSKQLRLLGMLLRWDAAALQPSDAISGQRVQEVEAACRAAGLDAAALLGVALEA